MEKLMSILLFVALLFLLDKIPGVVRIKFDKFCLVQGLTIGTKWMIFGGAVIGTGSWMSFLAYWRSSHGNFGDVDLYFGSAFAFLIIMSTVPRLAASLQIDRSDKIYLYGVSREHVSQALKNLCPEFNAPSDNAMPSWKIVVNEAKLKISFGDPNRLFSRKVQKVEIIAEGQPNRIFRDAAFDNLIGALGPLEYGNTKSSLLLIRQSASADVAQKSVIYTVLGVIGGFIVSSMTLKF
jgi:hypothetical protein